MRITSKFENSRIDLAESASDRIRLGIIDLKLMMKTLTLKNLYFDSFGLRRMFCHDCAAVFVRKREFFSKNKTKRGFTKKEGKEGKEAKWDATV